MSLITDPRDLLLGDDNDLVIEDGDLVWSRGIDAVVQDARIVLQMFQGEWFMDLDAGIPYWGSILGKKPAVAIAAARSAFRQALLGIEDVTEVLVLEVTYAGATRAMSIRWKVRCTFGDTPTDVIALRVGGGA